MLLHRRRWLSTAVLSVLPLLGLAHAADHQEIRATRVKAGTTVVAPTCGGETMPARKQPLRCGLDVGVSADTGDATEAIHQALRSLAATGSHLFLPAGSYAIQGALKLPPGAGLVGSLTGQTRLTSEDPNSAGLVQSGDDGKHNLIEGLHLYNVRVIAHRAATVRFNVFRQTRATDAQLVLSGRGGHVVRGNVFWRETDHPGEGIDLRSTASEEPAETRNVIEKNLVGAFSLAEYVDYISDDPEIAKQLKLDQRTLRIAQRADQHHSQGSDGARNGTYTIAMRISGNVPAVIMRNRFFVGPAKGESVPGIGEFMFSSPRHLKLISNSFAGLHRYTSVRVQSPSDTLLRWNSFDQATLIFETDDSQRPTKRTRVEANNSTGLPIRVDVAVNGAGEDQTTPADLRFIDNLSNFSPWRVQADMACGYQLRPPEVGTQNFEVAWTERKRFMATRVCASEVGA